MNIWHAAWVLPGVLTASCATIEPSAVSVELDHVSHATQHFTQPATNYGYNAANLVIRWQHDRVYATLAEGIVLDNPACGGQCYGALWGPREVFTGQLGVNLWTK